VDNDYSFTHFAQALKRLQKEDTILEFFDYEYTIATTTQLPHHNNRLTCLKQVTDAVGAPD